MSPISFSLVTKRQGTQFHFIGAFCVLAIFFTRLSQETICECDAKVLRVRFRQVQYQLGMLSVSRAGRTQQDVANIFGHTSHLLHLQRLGQPGLLIGTRLSLSPSLPSRLILPPDCLLFRLKLRPPVHNWSNCNRSCWKTAKI